MRKKNKLYTANKWNRPLFEDNIFDFGGTLSDSVKGIGGSVLGDPTKINLGQINTMKTPNLGISQGLGSIAKNGISAAGSAIGALGSNLISGGYSSGAGNGISTVGNTIGGAISTVNPLVGGIVSAASGIIGGATNALFGMKTNQKNLTAANQGTDYLNNFVSDAASFEDVQGPDAVASVQNAYKGGLFKKGKARRKNNALREARNIAQSWADRSVDNNINNIADTQMDNMLANYAAFGGQLNPISSGGAIDYGFMSDYLTIKNNANQAKNKISSNVFGNLPVTPMSTFALGGDMQTNGSDFSNGLVHISAGGSHEQNPYNGIQVGVDAQGTPNLVEEGETIFDDYVFSKRLKADAKTKKKFHVSKNADISFADLSKKLEKESEERPNDALSQAGLTKMMHDLADEQERQKGEEQAREAQEAFEQLPPEQQQAIMQQVAMEQQQAQEQQMQGGQQPLEGQQEIEPQQMEQQNIDANMQQQQPIEEAQVNACGGKINRFDKGGDMKKAIYNALNLYTDSDFEKWRMNQKLDEIKDWENITKNKEFMSALAGVNPALSDAISRGYDFGAFVPSKNNKLTFDFKHGGWGLENYDAWNGSTDAAWKEAVEKGLVKKGMNSEEIGKALSQTDAYKRGSDWLKADEGNRLTYLQSILNSQDAPQAARDYAARYVNSNGWLKDAKRDYQTIFEDPNGTGVRNTHPGTYWKTPNEILRDKLSGNYEVKEDGTVEPIIGDVPKDWTNAGSYNWQDEGSDYSYNYYKRPAASSNDNNTNPEQQGEIVPVHKPTWGRYVGAMGPLVNLGMMAAGVGKPNYSGLDAAIAAASGSPAMAHYKPIGNYLTYRPMDIWYEQNRMNANSRATDRAILNNSSPMGTKMAGLLANGYNSQIGSGNLYRQALEYNDAQRQKVEEFNRGTDMYNANAFNQTSATNAQMQNSHRNFKAQMMANAANERLNTNASWYNSLYGNVSGIFNNLGAIGKENAQHNMIADMAADGIFGNMNEQNIGRGYITKKTKKAKGGRINRKKGLTF